MGTADPPGETMFSTDGRLAATQVGKRILIWEPASGREVGRHDLEGVPLQFLLSARGRGWR